MPLDEFNDRARAQRHDRRVHAGLRPGLTVAILALVGDVAYFWWAFAGLGAVMLIAAVC